MLGVYPIPQQGAVHDPLLHHLLPRSPDLEAFEATGLHQGVDLGCRGTGPPIGCAVMVRADIGRVGVETVNDFVVRQHP